LVCSSNVCQQAEKWIASLSTRRRKPVKPATVFGRRHALDKWILPTIGDMPLADVSNAALKLVIDAMAAGCLAPKTNRQLLTIGEDGCGFGCGFKRR